ncbi:MAG TPA: LuxR family transcriptional regulator [Solirubrobacteraceae bacterium]|nr:LuxR family transcriptional regulator [Solirubrobacteraceae bacterium]
MATLRGLIVGRTRERSELEAVLEAARDGRSTVLVVQGEAGIGKSTLLDEAVAAAPDFRVLRARGYESESDIPFAGLLDLLSPLLDLLDRIPPAQAAALRGSLALGEPVPHDRFAVPAAVLSLLGAAAEEHPVLAIVDDVHWLDAASLEALLFAARRVAAEGIVLLLAARDGEGFDARSTGLARLRVGALDPGSARALLERRAGGLADTVAEQLLATADGNPLALVEIPTLLDAGQLAGRVPLPAPLPPGSSIEGAFRRQLERLPEDTRRALVVVSAMQTNRVDVLHEALGRLGIDRDCLRVAEDAGVVHAEGGRMLFRHPLLRATVYHGASAPERRAAHDVLAAVAPDAQRRAWHLAHAAVAPDESVAAALEAAGRDARDRGGHSAAAAAFARAAELSVDDEARARRDLEAATDFTLSAQFDKALALIDDGLALTADPVLKTDLRRARGHLELRRGAPLAAHAVLSEEAEWLEAQGDRARAATTLIEASVAHMMTGDMVALGDGARRARALAHDVAPAVEALATLIEGETLLALGRTAEGEALLAPVMPFLLEGDPLAAGLPEVVGMAGQCSTWIEEFDRAQAILDRLVRSARDAAAVGLLIYPLAARSHLEFRVGRWAAAIADAGESVELARETGQIGLMAHSLTALARIESAIGRSGDAQAHGRESLEICRAMGGDAIRVYALSVLAFDDLAGGRVESAIELLDEATEVADRLQMDEPALVQWAPDHVEALARAGEADRARAALERFERQAEATQRRWALAAAARCRGLLAGDRFAEHFEAALRWHEHGRQPFERARTQLAYAERLRRARQRAEARPFLSAALDTFERLGARPWADRARSELTATGGPSGPRPDASRADELTPQELKIALLVAQGLTNREVAASLFLSPKTIEHHLSAIYRKLDVRSRTQLARLLADERAPAAA